LRGNSVLQSLEPPSREIISTPKAMPDLRLPILAYHQIAVPSRHGTPFRGLRVHPLIFSRHMRWLARLGYRGLSIRDLAPYILGEREGKVFGLTFDDGFQNVLRNAAPILGDLNFTATNYIVAGHVGGANFWDEEKGVPTSRLMNGTELREWTALGHEIGAHTIDHADLTCLEQERARAQVRGSRKLLENIIGDEVLAFCYPYGRYRLEHVDMVREAGFTSAVTTDPGHVRLSSDRHSLPRISVARSTSFLMLARKMFVR
jgi:peptidoglycan/xylan/chitin deacetylase (PgdA/CDA1 family)